MKIIFLFFGAILTGTTTAQQFTVEGQLYWSTPESVMASQLLPYSGVPLEIFVHELTSTAEVDIENGVITKIYTPVKDRFFCKSNGTFKVKLPAGRYSVFARYQGAFYGNIKDTSDNLSPVFLSKKKSEWITITINYPSQK